MKWFGGFGRGTYLPVYGKQGARFGVFICYESAFEDLPRDYRRLGADFLVNITNDAWFGRTSAPYQHESMVRMRAIESRMGIARAANTGISEFIDPLGHAYHATELGTQAILADRPDQRCTTLYVGGETGWASFRCSRRLGSPVSSCAGAVRDARTQPGGDAMTWVLVGVIGVFSGVASGLFGVGGAIVIIPALVMVLKMSQHAANGTALAALILPVGLLGAAEYYRRGEVNIPYAILIAAGLFVGALIGAKLAGTVSDLALRRAFGVACRWCRCGCSWGGDPHAGWRWSKTLASTNRPNNEASSARSPPLRS